MISNDKHSIGPKILWMQINLPIVIFVIILYIDFYRILNYIINCGFTQHWRHNFINISKRNDKSM
jgi:hypothetical protein